MLKKKYWDQKMFLTKFGQKSLWKKDFVENLCGKKFSPKNYWFKVILVKRYGKNHLVKKTYLFKRLGQKVLVQNMLWPKKKFDRKKLY